MDKKTRKKIRQKSVRKRKNFLPSLIAVFILWIFAAGIVYFTDPQVKIFIPILFLVLFFAFLITFSLIFASSRRGIIAAIAFLLFLLLRLLGIGNIVNFILIVGLSVSIEILLSHNT